MEGQGQASKPTPQIRTIAVKLTHVGQARNNNEDTVAIEIPGNETLQAKGSLNLVADGMGGYQAGEVASQRAAEVIVEEYYADPTTDPAASLSRAMRRANRAVYEMAQKDMQRAGMGTTAVAAAVRGSEVYIANVGDSRAYVLRKGELTQITIDHSFVQEQIDANILTPEAARTHPKRNVITRALGHKAEVQVDTFEGQLSPGDLLLLCSDGLCGTLNDNDMQAILNQAPPQEAVMRLINEANLRGGPDNISAVIVQGLRYDPAVPAAMEVTPGVQPTPAMVPHPPPETPTRSPGGRGRLVIASLAVFLVLALVAAGAFLVLRGNRDDQTPAFTPGSPVATTPAQTPTAVTPSSSPVGTIPEPSDTPIPIVTSGTITSTTTPVGTPGETDAASTGTPAEPVNPSSTPFATPSLTFTSSPCQAAAPDTLIAPQPLASFPANSAVTFSWSGGSLCTNQVWQVTINNQPIFCPATVENQVTCNLTEAGQQVWRVEVWQDSGQPVDRIVSEERGIIISSGPTDSPAQPSEESPTRMPPAASP